MSEQSKDLDQFTATDTGGRNPIGWQAKVIFWGALGWGIGRASGRERGVWWGVVRGGGGEVRKT